MASKSLLLLSLLLATFFLATIARDLAERTEEKGTREGGLENQKWPYPYPGGGYYPGRGIGYVGGGWPGGVYPGGGYPGGGYYPGGGLVCQFGCCYSGYSGFCRACCPYPGAEKEAQPGN